MDRGHMAISRGGFKVTPSAPVAELDFESWIFSIGKKYV
jgi:hypothetical protein